MKLVCSVCGEPFRLDAGHLRCPASTAECVHPLRKEFAIDELSPYLSVWESRWNADEATFSVFRETMGSWHLARSAGMESRWLERVREIDSAARMVAGRGLVRTPLLRADHTAQTLGLPANSLVIKDETHQLTGSHKARHLAGAILYLETLEWIRGEALPDLAIFSCGNAALAGAAVARAAGRRLHAFVPSHVNPSIERMLLDFGADVVKVARTDTGGGDPCHNAYQSALKEFGWVPFSCYGHDNWASVEGAEALGLELLLEAQWLHEPVDTLLVQVGGGGLANALIAASHLLHDNGHHPHMPRIHACQTASCYPLARAYLTLVRELLDMGVGNLPASVHSAFAAHADMPALQDNAPQDLIATAWALQRCFAEPLMQEHLRRARCRRGELFRPWFDNVPESVADGILDDTTYDGMEVVFGLLETGGLPLVLSEKELQAAVELSHEFTALRPSATGTAGLAGLAKLISMDAVTPEEGFALLFTGVER